LDLGLPFGAIPKENTSAFEYLGLYYKEEFNDVMPKRQVLLLHRGGFLALTKLPFLIGLHRGISAGFLRTHYANWQLQDVLGAYQLPVTSRLTND